MGWLTANRLSRGPALAGTWEGENVRKCAEPADLAGSALLLLGRWRTGLVRYQEGPISAQDPEATRLTLVIGFV